MDSFGDEPLGPWPEEYKFTGEEGCRNIVAGFVLFSVVVLILWLVLFN
jgi:hypothetical protein